MKNFLILFLLITTTYSAPYKLRKYPNVEKFYALIAKDVIQLAIKYQTPPAAILAIAGLESGYGSGYVAQITGNILSLGANKNEKELPALYLPYCKDDQQKRTLFDKKEQEVCKNLIWKKRPKSLKKDYRPLTFAGTDKNLAYFKYHLQEYKQAQLQNIQDFLVKWLHPKHKYKPFRNCKIWLTNQVSQKGVKTLFDLNTNLKFINKIGGRKNSFNYRKSWVKKVIYILQNSGLVELSYDMYYHKTPFNRAWNSHKSSLKIKLN